MARYTRGVTHPEGTTFPSPAFPLGSQGLVAARTSGDGMGQEGPAGRALQGRAQARGFVEFTPAGWCVERPDVYVFTIGWETLEDHTQGFRDSALFEQWRALIGPHFAQPPVVEHYAR